MRTRCGRRPAASIRRTRIHVHRARARTRPHGSWESSPSAYRQRASSNFSATIYTHEAVAAEPVQLNTNLGYYTNFVNLLDLAAVAVPAGTRANGLPFGISLIGHAFSDEALVTVAGRFCGSAPVGDPACPPG